MNNKWIQWATTLQSIAQAGLTFSENSYDLDRYRQIRALSVEIMNEYTGVSHERLEELFAGETGYQTPKTDIRSAVFKDDKILLVREKVDGAWSLPGGWADVNSSPSESALRECREEAGAIVKPKRIIAIHEASKHNNPLNPYSIYKIFFECELIETTFHENTETMEAGFFPLNELPPLSTDRTTAAQIEMCFHARKQDVVQPVFD
jgi:ADP-ribose pyrophosphatase YjhB (NUDIX family)